MSGLGRSLRFLRHVPLRQVGRRFGLKLRRALERRLRPGLDAAATMASAPPLPLFPPRQGMAERTDGGWRFRFLGREVEMTGAIDWRSGEDQLWRMNLHYMEYLEELDDASVAEALRQWLAANPAYAAGAEQDGWSAYSISLRTVVWMQQLAARPRLDAGLRAAAQHSLIAQLIYLHRHLESDVGGNHLIKNLKALLWGSACFEGPAAARWRGTALKLLGRELDRQILPDGMHFELSPAYHCQVLADLLETRHALASDPLGGRLDAALGRAAGAAALLAHPDGRIALFGDAGLGMAYAPALCLKAARTLLGIEAEPPRAVFALPDAGYFGTRSDGDYLLVDAGPLGPASLPAHSHADIFSFEWSLAGERVIVDQGVFEYVAGPRRQASRTAASHNTLCLEGADQAEFFGAFRVGRRPRVELLRYEPSEDGFTLEARHDGFARLTGRPIHRRIFVAAGGRLRIEDRIDGNPTAPARVGLLLAPQIRPEIVVSEGVRLRGERASALLTASAPFAIEDAVWWPDMGVEVPTKRLVIALRPGESAWMELAPAGGHRGLE
jgi:uncharacterized heparinase superfamily protein